MDKYRYRYEIYFIDFYLVLHEVLLWHFEWHKIFFFFYKDLFIS
jgi:hypothetical protein